MLSLFSPAKINLFLRVLRKRKDGYHELATLLQAIDLGDTLDIQLSQKDSLTCTDPSIPTDASNLVIKAANLFRQKTGITSGLKVHLHKRIPAQAGLGGGSSNAATTLWAFNQLVGKVATTEELQAWSGEIGSDIPFFFSQGTAYCTGRGEHVQSVQPLSSPSSCWIIKPPIGLSTPEIYRRLRLTSSQPIDHQKDLLKHWHYVNDLEQPAFEARADLYDLKQALIKQGFNTVLMTGSGSAFFCLGENVPSQSGDISTYLASFLRREEGCWYQRNDLN